MHRVPAHPGPIPIEERPLVDQRLGPIMGLFFSSILSGRRRNPIPHTHWPSLLDILEAYRYPRSFAIRGALVLFPWATRAISLASPMLTPVGRSDENLFLPGSGEVFCSATTNFTRQRIQIDAQFPASLAPYASLLIAPRAVQGHWPVICTVDAPHPLPDVFDFSIGLLNGGLSVLKFVI